MNVKTLAPHVIQGHLLPVKPLIEQQALQRTVRTAVTTVGTELVEIVAILTA